jgi:hypothetical protein
MKLPTRHGDDDVRGVVLRGEGAESRLLPSEMTGCRSDGRFDVNAAVRSLVCGRLACIAIDRPKAVVVCCSVCMWKCRVPASTPPPRADMQHD